MSEVHSLEEFVGQLPPSRQGRLLCSPRDPQREAQRWLERITIRPDVEHLLLLGLGAGHQLLALHKAHPEKKITVFESNKALVEMFQRQSWSHPHPHPHSHSQLQVQVQLLTFESLSEWASRPHQPQSQFNYQVLSFRPAWALQEHIYMDAYFYLTGRSETELQRQKAALQNHPGAVHVWSLLMELIH